MPRGNKTLRSVLGKALKAIGTHRKGEDYQGRKTKEEITVDSKERNTLVL